MAKFQAWLQTTTGKFASLTVSLLAVALAVWAVISNLGNGTVGDPNSIFYVDVATGKSFRHTNEAGEMVPIKAPSGGETGYPAEACYWNADGTTKKDPTWVATNEIQDKPGPTFCPDCGRLVIPRNPSPVPGGRPPRTRAELLRGR